MENNGEINSRVDFCRASRRVLRTVCSYIFLSVTLAWQTKFYPNQKFEKNFVVTKSILLSCATRPLACDTAILINVVGF